MNRKIILLSVITASMLFTGCGSSDGFTTENSTPIPIDTIAPVITLNGTKVINIQNGTTYTDAGATAIDKIDGVVNVSTSGIVDSSKDGKYTITYTASDKSGNTATMTREIIVEKVIIDITAPVITLNGESTITIKIEETYTEQGAKTDDGSSIVTSGTVDTSKVGTYTITYNSVDKAGNKATELKRTVTIVDLITPIITLNGASTITLNVGDTYTEQGAKTDDDSTVTISGDVVDTSKVGTYTITYNSMDDAENKAIEVKRTVIVEEKIYTISGYAIDGPIKDARVYLDANDNGAYDENETKTTTNTVGYYEFKFKTDVVYDISIVVDGGIDTVTGEDFEGVLKKRYQKGDTLKSLMVTPSSTLVDTFVKKDKITLKDARVKVAKFLEIKEEDIAKNPTVDVELYKINLMLLEWIKQLDNGFEELAEDIKDTNKTIETFSNEKTYILDAIYKLVNKITKVPKAGEGNGEIDDILTPEPIDAQVVVDKVKESLDILGKNTDLSNITANLNLKPMLTQRAVDISFKTESDAINIETGVVTRPVFGQDDINTTITATITKSDVTATKEFEIIIKSLPKVEDAEVQAIIDRTKAMFTWEKIKSSNAHAQNDTPDNVTASPILPDYFVENPFEDGITVEYISENEQLLIQQPSDGNPKIVVVKQIILDTKESVTGDLKINIYYNKEYKDTVTHHITVVYGLGDESFLSYKEVGEEFEKLIEVIDGVRYLKEGITRLPIENSYNHPVYYNHYRYLQDIIIAQDGTVTHPSEDTLITMIWLNSSVAGGTSHIIRDFTIRAIDNDITLEDAKEALGFKDIKGTNTIDTEVTTDLTLVTTLDGFDGVTISWASSNETAISTTGAVIQGAEDTSVTLTATLSKTGEESVTKIIEVTVPAKGGDILPKAKEALDFDDIKNANRDSENVTSDLEMITSLAEFEGVVISWESDNSAIDASTGEVTQPEGGGKGDTAKPIDVILTATLSKDGEESVSKPINVTVLPVEDGGKK